MPPGPLSGQEDAFEEICWKLAFLSLADCGCLKSQDGRGCSCHRRQTQCV